MDKNPLSKGVFTEHGLGVGVITKKMIRERAQEVALINGRKPHELEKTDWEQAKRELTGGPTVDAETALLESLSADEGWDELPEVGDHQAPQSPMEDEDEEGRSETAQLVEEGVQEADHDQRLAAAREKQKEEAEES